MADRLCDTGLIRGIDQLHITYDIRIFSSISPVWQLRNTSIVVHYVVFTTDSEEIRCGPWANMNLGLVNWYQRRQIKKHTEKGLSDWFRLDSENTGCFEFLDCATSVLMIRCCPCNKLMNADIFHEKWRYIFWSNLSGTVWSGQRTWIPRWYRLATLRSNYRFVLPTNVTAIASELVEKTKPKSRSHRSCKVGKSNPMCPQWIFLGNDHRLGVK